MCCGNCEGDRIRRKEGVEGKGEGRKRCLERGKERVRHRQDMYFGNCKSSMLFGDV